MNILVGTSGWSYKQWKGSFYPADLSADDMLRHYAARLPTVEINNSFYRIPKEKVLLDWAEQVPAEFRFVLKASRRITHINRLADADDSLEYFLRTVNCLGDRLGPRCSSAPPRSARTWSCSATSSAGCRAPGAQRSSSGTTPGSTRRCTRRCGATTWRSSAWTRTRRPTPLVPTASWGYLRLRKTEYAEDELRAWAERVQAQPWGEAFVFLKHDEDSAAGPDAAVRLAGIVAQKELSP